jgi:hypothetical protein
LQARGLKASFYLVDGAFDGVFDDAQNKIEGDIERPIDKGPNLFYQCHDLRILLHTSIIIYLSTLCQVLL